MKHPIDLETIEKTAPAPERGSRRTKLVLIVVFGGLAALSAAAMFYQPNLDAGNDDDQYDQTALGKYDVPEASVTRPIKEKNLRRVNVKKPVPKKTKPREDKIAQFQLELLKNSVKDEMAARASSINIMRVHKDETAKQQAAAPKGERTAKDELMASLAAAIGRSQGGGAALDLGGTAAAGKRQAGGVAYTANGLPVVTDQYQSNAPANPNDSTRLALLSTKAQSDAPDPYGRVNVSEFGHSEPFTIRAGTIIPARTMQGINSDTPGMVRGMVQRNVYDSITGRAILIPKGSIVIGKYANGANYGDERVQVVWNRIQYPNGDEGCARCGT